jgi:AraC-like DNA-binding protein
VQNFVEQQRMLAARRMLVEARLSVKEIAHAVGFEDPFYFSRRFTRQFGVSPTGLRDAHGMI